MASTLRPGIEIQQVIRETPTLPNPPALVPAIVGPCYQIINILNTDGSLNTAAKSSTGYSQAAVSFTQSEIPDAGRDNLDEIDVLETDVSAAIQYGTLNVLERGSHSSTGSAFLGKFPEGKRAAICFPGIYTFVDSVDGSTTAGDEYLFDSAVSSTNPFLLVVTLDNGTPKTVQFTESSYTAQELADVFVAQGIEAAVVTSNNESFCVIYSKRYGSRSSIKLSGGAGALEYLFGNQNFFSTGNAHDFEVYGSGIGVLDDQDSDSLSPYFHYFIGSMQVNSVDNAAAPDNNARSTFGFSAYAGSYTGTTFKPGVESEKTFLGSPADIPLKACSQSNPGDVIVSGGSQLLNAEVYTVEETRFTLAVLDTENSTYDAATGEITKRKYIPVEANVFNQFATSGRFAYAVAQNLTSDSVSATAASVEGANTPTESEAAAVVVADNSITGTLALTGKTLTLKVTTDGVEGDWQVIQFAGALTPTNAAAFINDNSTGVVASISDSCLNIATIAKGADQKLSLTTTESTTAATLLGFDAAQTASGRDFGFGTVAELASLDIQLPLTQFSSVDLDLSDGTYTLSLAGMDFSSATNLGDVISVIVSESNGSGSTIQYNGIDFLTLETSDDSAIAGTLTFKSIQAGSSATVEILNAEEEGVRALGFADNTGTMFQAAIPLTNAAAAVLTGSKDVVATIDGETVTYVTPSLSSNTRAEIVEHLNSVVTPPAYSSSNTEVLVFIDDADNEEILVRCVSNSAAAMSVASTIATPGAASDILSTADDTSTGTDTLVGTKLIFTLDDNPTAYSVTLTSNSVADLVDLVNSEETGVGGSIPVASLKATGEVVLTSSFKGLASRVKVDSSGTAASVLGLSTTLAEGTGRPAPDFYIDLSGVLHIGANILRDTITGTPAARKDVVGAASIYFGYKALRKDVSSSADEPSVLSFSNASQVASVIGPISTDNPLAMAAFLALSNAPLVDVSVLGIDEVSTAAPMGTVTAYSKALSYLESQDVYCLVPLTDSLFVCQLFSTHVQAMSQPSERSERICFLWQPIPNRGTDTSIQSGTAGETNGSDNEFLLESTPVADLVAAGVTDTELNADDNVYIEMVLISAGESIVRNYSVQEVDGPRLVLRTSFASGENDDGFYSETDLTGEYTDVTYSLRVRGELLVLKGTSIPDKSAQVSAAGSLAGQFASRRVYLTALNSADTVVNGIVFNVPGYYVSAAIAGMVAQQEPQQPFTNVAIAGFTKVYGTDDSFTENQLDVMADGGRYIIVNQNGGIASRHQRSTATLSIESRELSITKAIDFVAKGLRAVNKGYIGRFVITPGFLDQLTMVNQGFLVNQEDAGVVSSADLVAVLQDESAPDTVLIEIQVQPAYPCNKINITILS